jgi:hypothetical protein
MSDFWKTFAALSILTWTILIWGFIAYGVFCLLVAMVTEPFSKMGILAWITVGCGVVGWWNELKYIWKRIWN